MFVVGLALSAGATPAKLEQVDVFVSGQETVLEYRIPSFVSTNQGPPIAFCDARVKMRGDEPNDFDLVMKRSTDGGRTLPRFNADYHRPRTQPEDACSFACYSDDHGQNWAMGTLIKDAS